MLRFRPLLLTVLLVPLLVLALSMQVVHGCSHIGAPGADDCTLCLHSQASHPNPVTVMAAPVFTLLPLPLLAAPLVVVTIAPRYRRLARAPPVAVYPATPV